jgi:hypothetical protein
MEGGRHFRSRMVPEEYPTRRGLLAATAAVAASGLAGCSLLGPSFPEEQPPEDLKAKARTFVERVERGDYEAATEPFTETMREELPPETLEKTWEDNVGDIGAYEDIEKWGYRTDDGLDVVFSRVACEKGSYDLKTVWNDDGKLAGVWFVNKRRSG